jgi:hypothetical protein
MVYNIYEFEKWLLKNDYFYFPKGSKNRGLYIEKNLNYIRILYKLNGDFGNFGEGLKQNEIIELYNKFLYEERFIKINIILNE